MTVHVLDVVDGELSADFERRTRQLMQQYRIPAGIGTNLRQVTGAPLDPPSEWNGIPLTCQRCDEGCDMYGDHGPLRCEHSGCCPECIEGHPIIEHQVPCPADCYPVVSGLCQVCGELPYGADGPHRNPGKITARVSIQAVPIAERDDRSETSLVLFINPVGDAYYYDPAERINLYVGHYPVARPGQFAIVATEVTSHETE